MSNFSKIHSFQKSLSAEAQWLPKTKELFPGCHLKEVAHLPEYQPLGVDFLVKREARLAAGLELKFDSYSSGNLALEWVSQDRPSSPGALPIKEGWMATCQAGWLAYALVSTGDLLLMEMATLRDWLSQNYHRFGSTSVANKTYFSYCSLVPLNQLLRELPAEKCFWFDMRSRLPSHSFEESPLATEEFQSKPATAEAVAHAILEGEGRSAPLEMTPAEKALLWTHLWEKNRLQKKHSVLEGRRKIVLKALIQEPELSAAA
jgi:hypothetical protein